MDIVSKTTYNVQNYIKFLEIPAYFSIVSFMAGLLETIKLKFMICKRRTLKDLQVHIKNTI